MSEVNNLAVDAFEDTIASLMIEKVHEIEDREGFNRYDRKFIMSIITSKIELFLKNSDNWDDIPRNPLHEPIEDNL